MKISLKSAKFTRKFIFLVLPNILGLIILSSWRMISPKIDLFSQILLVSILVFFISTLLSTLANKKDQLLQVYFKKTLFVSLVMALIFYNLTTATLLNIDRSRSFYVLAWLDEDLLRVDTEGRLINYATSKESINLEAISERLEEHRGRFFVTNEYKLTTLGKEAVRVSHLLARIFTLEGWFKNNQ